MKRVVLVALAAATSMLWAQPGLAQPADELKAMRKEVETLKEGQTAIQKQLQDIKTLLQARPPAAAAPGGAAPQEATLALDGSPAKGEKTAKIAMVEFTDYQ
jgi:protein-disulfide isomerase